MRGEYPTRYATKMDRAELPPRARRILGLIRCCKACRGTTSACAENTQHVEPCKLFRRNYLRVRGEYAPARPLGIFSSELPPRARRIPAREVMAAATEGTTSACAENTRSDRGGALFVGNYLRVRGEYTMADRMDQYLTELPPRARRILVGRSWRGCCLGTTSACAENTFPW